MGRSLFALELEQCSNQPIIQFLTIIWIMQNRSPWKHLRCTADVHNFPFLSGMATSLISLHRPCWFHCILKQWFRVLVPPFCQLPSAWMVTRHTHFITWHRIGVWCLWRKTMRLLARGDSWWLVHCGLGFPSSSPLLLTPFFLWLLHIFESLFFFRHFESDQWSFWELNGGNMASTISSLEIRDVLKSPLTFDC